MKGEKLPKAFIGFYQEFKRLRQCGELGEEWRLVDSFDKTLGINFVAYRVGFKAPKLKDYKRIIQRIEMQMNRRNSSNLPITKKGERDEYR